MRDTVYKFITHMPLIITPAHGCDVGVVVVVVEPVVVVDPVVVVGFIVVVVVEPVVVVGFIVVVVEPVVVVAFVVVDAPVVVVAPEVAVVFVVGSVETVPEVDETQSRRPDAKRQTIPLRRVRSATSSRKHTSELGAAVRPARRPARGCPVGSHSRDGPSTRPTGGCRA